MSQGGESVSVCVVTWNSATQIEECLGSVFSQTGPPREVVVVDNASSDGTAERVARFGARARLLRNRRNLGFSAGVNRGLRATSGAFFATLNPDVRLAPDYLALLVRELEGDPELGFATGCLVRPGSADAPRIDSAGLLLGRDRRGRDRGRGRAPEGVLAEPARVFAACGAAAVFRRRMLADLAYPNGEVFDESFFCYKEDLDLGWRAHRRGWSGLCLPAARGIHRRGWREGGRGGVDLAVRVHSFKNRYLMMVKNETLRGLLAGLGALAWFELRALIYWVLFEPGLWKAYPALARSLPDAWRKRGWSRARTARRSSTRPGA